MTIPKQEIQVSHLKTAFKLIHRLTGTFSVLLIIAATLYFGNRLYRRLQTSALFEIKTIQIKGCHILSKQDLLIYLNLKPKTNLLALKVRPLYVKLLAHRWIKAASIQRFLPNTLSITIMERRPVALLKAGKLYYVDKNGTPFDTINKDVGCDFPVFTGPTDSTSIKAFMPLLRKSLSLINKDTNQIISEINLNLSNGVTLVTLPETLPVRLGKKDLNKRLHRFLKTYRFIRRRGIQAKYLDCRYPDRVVLKYAKPPHAHHSSLEVRSEKTG
jgi:cell division protein FtsQ